MDNFENQWLDYKATTLDFLNDQYTENDIRFAFYMGAAMYMALDDSVLMSDKNQSHKAATCQALREEVLIGCDRLAKGAKPEPLDINKLK